MLIVSPVFATVPAMPTPTGIRISPTRLPRATRDQSSFLSRSTAKIVAGAASRWRLGAAALSALAAPPSRVHVAAACPGPHGVVAVQPRVGVGVGLVDRSARRRRLSREALTDAETDLGGGTLRDARPELVPLLVDDVDGAALGI